MAIHQLEESPHVVQSGLFRTRATNLRKCYIALVRRIDNHAYENWDNGRLDVFYCKQPMCQKMLKVSLRMF